MDETHLRKCLARADRNVAYANEGVARERQRVAQLERDAQDVSMLRVLEHSRDAYEKNRQMIIELLEMTGGGSCAS